MGCCAQVVDAHADFVAYRLARPVQLSSGSISEVTEVTATVRVRLAGREAEGRGTVLLSDVWAWPGGGLSHSARDAALRRMCSHIAQQLSELCGGEPAHPLELGLRLHNSVVALPEGPELPPELARVMCASPFDAAIHDAVGHALQRSAFSFYDEPAAIPSGDPYFAGGSTTEAIQRTLLPPASHLNAWLVVGAEDDLVTDVAPWVVGSGYRSFKLRLSGANPLADANRTACFFTAVRSLGVQNPRLAADTNCGSPDPDGVMEFLDRLRTLDSDAFDALEYIEQPTARDIVAHPHDWTSVSKLKPVVLDEGLTGLGVLDEAVAQGWTGLAIKTCKGHSLSLAAAAWGREHDLVLAMQDLTNTGLAAIHAALFAAHLPMVNGIELNSPQYLPAGNAAWLPRLSGLFCPERGRHVVPEPRAWGLGSEL